MSEPQGAGSPADPQCRRFLIVTGDDFGANPRVNEAVEALHRAGFLTQASLMVNEPGADEALRIARRNPGLAVGLHLSLCCGRASRVSALTDGTGRFSPSPARAGVRYAFSRRVQGALEKEIAAQFEAFATLGLPPVYWDGHTHLHLHPTVLDLTLPVARAHGFGAVRLVREPGWQPLPVIFRLLSRSAQAKLGAIRYADRVFGLRHTGRITTRRLALSLARVPPGWTELYFHPGAEPAQIDGAQLAALAGLRGIRLTTSRELAGAPRPGP